MLSRIIPLDLLRNSIHSLKSLFFRRFSPYLLTYFSSRLRRSGHFRKAEIKNSQKNLRFFRYKANYASGLFFLCMSSLFGAGHQLSLSFYEKGRFDLVPPVKPGFMQGREKEADKGFMLFYEQRMGSAPFFASFYGGGNLGLWHKDAQDFCTSTLFFSSKFFPLPLPLIHPYVEVSTFGPTLFFQGVSMPRLLFQNFLGVGVELGGSLGLVVDLRMIRYYTKELTVAHEGLQVPAVLSVGFLF